MLHVLHELSQWVVILTLADASPHLVRHGHRGAAADGIGGKKI